MPTPDDPAASIPADEMWRYERTSWWRGMRVRRATFETALHGDHAHCVGCWGKFMEGDWPGTQREGYQIEHPLHDDYWNWLCSECFDLMHEVLDWQLADPPPDPQLQPPP